MKSKIFFTAIALLLILSIILTSALVQASLLQNVWYNTLAFLGVIEITQANHLNSDRIIISDIYPEVRSLDGIWSEPINNNEYVRVTFKQNLTKNNDITIYARTINNQTSEIEVYEKDKDILLAKFKNVGKEEVYKIYLSNLSKTQDVFDLRIIGNPVEFDYIVDPAAGDYRTSSSGLWGNKAIWERYDGGSWVAATAIPSSSDEAIDILNGHKVIFNSSITVDQLTVDAGGTLVVKEGITMTIGSGAGDDLIIDGTVNCTGTITFANTALFSMNSTGVLDLYPGGTFTPDVGTDLPRLNGKINVHESVTFQTTAAIVWTFGTSSLINISEGATFSFNSGGTVSVGKINGNVTCLNGSFNFGRGNGGLAGIINKESYVSLLGNCTLAIQSNGGAILYANGTIKIDPDAVINGMGDFIFNPIGTLIIGNVNGITSGTTASGAVQNTGGTRTFAPNASYIYNGIADQSAGNGLPSSVLGLSVVNGGRSFNFTGGVVYTVADVGILNFTGNPGSHLKLNSTNTTDWMLKVNATATQAVHYIAVSHSNASRGNIINAADGTNLDGGNNENWNFTSDTNIPLFSNYWDNNATLIDAGTGFFNVTLLNTNGTVLLEINNTNYTAFNSTGSVFNVSVEFTKGGIYSYRWHAWGNGTNHLYNVSEYRSYTVNSSAPAQCSPSLDTDWVISDTQICDGVQVTTGTGTLRIDTNGKLYLIGGANVTANKLEIKTTGDCIFVNPKSQLRVE